MTKSTTLQMPTTNMPGSILPSSAPTSTALGHPTDFHLTPGQDCDLDGAAVLLPTIAAETVIAEQAFDADERGLQPLESAGHIVVSPPKSNPQGQRPHDEE